MVALSMTYLNVPLMVNGMTRFKLIAIPVKRSFLQKSIKADRNIFALVNRIG